jgi:D-glycero-D-manno-heptose 1,7-bisphosphate phosphatase
VRPFIRKPTPVLFADLDGTVRKGKDDLGRFVHGPQDVELFPEAVVRLAGHKAAGFRIVGITNQGGIALFYAHPEALLAANDLTNALAGNVFDVMEMCPHHPDAEESELRLCFCRKPRIGMLVQAVTKLRALHPGEYYPPELSLLVGDRPEDEACADAAGIRFQEAQSWRAKGQMP